MAKASGKIFLKNILKGQWMTISAHSACGSTGTIVLKDDTTTYTTFKKTSSAHSHMLLGHEAKAYTGGSNLRVELDIEYASPSVTVKPIVNCEYIMDEKGNNKSAFYNIIVEDLTDNDSNDYIITVAVTNK